MTHIKVKTMEGTEEDDVGKRKYKHWKEVAAVIPVNNDFDDYQDTSGRFHNNVRVVVDALTGLYSTSPDYEMGDATP